MRYLPELVVMLTHNDRTVPDAPAIFEQCKHTDAVLWGMKEDGLPLAQMQALYSRMKALGKTTFLEVVAYTEAEGIKGAEMAALCGCDVLMGTMYFDAIRDFCSNNGIKYMPFVGEIVGRPSVLSGTISGMIAQAKECLSKGVYGIDLLAYRYTGDPGKLIQAFANEVQAPVCLAGSINSYPRLDEVNAAGLWAFTIGGAFFENQFGGTFAEQINQVCSYMKETAPLAQCR